MGNWPMARLVAEMQADAADPDYQKPDLPPLNGLDGFDDATLPTDSVHEGDDG